MEEIKFLDSVEDIFLELPREYTTVITKCGSHLLINASDNFLGSDEDVHNNTSFYETQPFAKKDFEGKLQKAIAFKYDEDPEVFFRNMPNYSALYVWAGPVGFCFSYREKVPDPKDPFYILVLRRFSQEVFLKFAKLSAAKCITN